MWLYDKGDHRYKHSGRSSEPVFTQTSGVTVGKCPNTITFEIAQKILNVGVGHDFTKTNEGQFPRQIFCYYEGVLYKALPTSPGISYHGFPACSGDLSPEAKRLILARYPDEDTRNRIKKWLRKADREIRNLQ